MQRNRHAFVASALTLPALWLVGCGDPPVEAGPPTAAAAQPDASPQGPPTTQVPAGPPALGLGGAKHLRLWLVAAATGAEREAAATTTTTLPPEPEPEVHTAAPPPPPPPAPASGGSVNGYPCGGDLPPCWVLDRESGGNPTAENPTSSASGLWQFLDSTWAGYGGFSHAAHAPWQVQNERARQLWAGGAGCSHWSAC